MGDDEGWSVAGDPRRQKRRAAKRKEHVETNFVKVDQGYLDCNYLAEDVHKFLSTMPPHEFTCESIWHGLMKWPGNNDLRKKDVAAVLFESTYGKKYLIRTDARPAALWRLARPGEFVPGAATEESLDELLSGISISAGSSRVMDADRKKKREVVARSMNLHAKTSDGGKREYFAVTQRALIRPELTLAKPGSWAAMMEEEEDDEEDPDPYAHPAYLEAS
jgi:hypothetical protein